VALDRQALVRARALCVAAVIATAAGFYVAAPSLISNFRPQASFYESPAFIPRLALAVMVICGLFHLAVLWRGRPAVADGEEFEIGAARPGPAIAAILLLLGYVGATPWIGYGAATVLFLLAAGWLAGLRWKLTVGLAAGATALLYGIFVVGLKVWFPAPEILAVLGW
jgi:hypothetical protein